MRYAICYDVSSDRARERVVRVLERYGSRVQESVFECELEPADRTALTAALSEVLAGEEHANVRCYRLCADCRTASFGLGELVVPVDARPWIVI